jgi:hypothetical protein
VMEENSFVKVTLILVNNVNNFIDCQSKSTQCRSRSSYRIPTTKRKCLWKSGNARSGA